MIKFYHFFVIEIGDNEIKELLAILFTGMPLMQINGQTKIFTDAIYNILQEQYPRSVRSSGRTPYFFLPQKVGVGVPMQRGVWRYFWSRPRGQHAEDSMFNDHQVANRGHPPSHVFINYTPCGNLGKNCYNKFITTYARGRCPQIFTIWPYLVSPAGVEMRQVIAIKKLIDHCGPIHPWSDIKPFVEVLCKNRDAITSKVRTQVICNEVKTALKARAFKQRTKVAKDLFEIIGRYNQHTSAAIERELKQRINKWIKDRYHNPNNRPPLLRV